MAEGDEYSSFSQRPVQIPSLVYFLSLFSVDNPPLFIGRPVLTVLSGLRLHKPISSDCCGTETPWPSFKAGRQCPRSLKRIFEIHGLHLFSFPRQRPFPLNYRPDSTCFYSDCNLMLSI